LICEDIKLIINSKISMNYKQIKCTQIIHEKFVEPHSTIWRVCFSIIIVVTMIYVDMLRKLEEKTKENSVIQITKSIVNTKHCSK